MAPLVGLLPELNAKLFPELYAAVYDEFCIQIFGSVYIAHARSAGPFTNIFIYLTITILILWGVTRRHQYIIYVNIFVNMFAAVAPLAPLAMPCGGAPLLRLILRQL